MDKIIYRVSAFPSDNKGGNEAGVVLDCADLSEKTMQQVAAQVGYSETAFLMPSKKADYKIRYFTPITEVDLCGHATIAAFNLLRNLDIITQGRYSLETNQEILEINVKEKHVFMQLGKMSLKDGPDKTEIKQSLGLSDAQLTKNPTKIISTGVEEIFLEVKDLKTLHRLNLDPLRLQRLCEKHHVKGLYLFTLETHDQESHAQGRNFLPVLGIPEESATGTASGALAIYMDQVLNKQQKAYRFEQGDAMQKPSRIHVELIKSHRDITRVNVGGAMRFIDKILKFM